jgi:hypothetical protein
MAPAHAARYRLFPVEPRIGGSPQTDSIMTTGRRALLPVAAIVAGWAQCATAAPADVTKFNVTFPMQETVTNPCTNEAIDFNGEWRDAGIAIIDAGRVTIAVKDSAHARGIAQVSGNEYQWLFDQSFAFGGAPVEDGPAAYSAERTERIVGPGTGNDFLVKVRVHFTVDARGKLAVERSVVSATCK